MASVTQDFRYAFRGLAHHPGLTLVSVLTLALAIGAVTPTFSFVDAYLLRPLPFEDPERLVHLWATDQRKGWSTLRVSYPDFRDWRAHGSSFEDLAAFNYTSEVLTGGEEPERIAAARVSANLFAVLGVGARQGRTFLEGEDQPGNTDVAIVSHQYWQRRLGADPLVLDRTLEVDRRPHRIVGVMPPEFVFPLPVTQFWLPRELDEARLERDASFLQVVGRLEPGVSAEQAEEELNVIAGRLASEYPETNTGRGVNVVSLRSALNFAHEIFQVMAVVLGVANLFVLLIACSNVSNLLLGRAWKRRREVAIRLAIGASRGRLIRQFLAESLVLALLGGGLGLLMAVWLVEALAAVIPDELYRVGSLQVDLSALMFTLGLAALTAFVFGLLPALRVSRVDVGESLKEAGSGLTASRQSLRLQKLLVGAEVGLALLLLVGTSMMVQTFLRLRQVDPGFSADNILTMKMILPDSKYATPESRVQFHERLLEAVRPLPAVAAAATVDYLPLNREMAAPGYSVPGQPPDPDGTIPTASLLSVSADYFEVFRIPLVAGRTFASQDHRETAPVALVNQVLAERLGRPGGDVIDTEIQVEGFDRPHRIVGVVSPTKHWDLDEAPLAQLYLHQLQYPDRYFRLAVRAGGDPMDVLPAVRSTIRGVDPDLPVTEARPMQQVLSEFLLPQKSVVVVLGLLSAGALLLAAVGIYGLMAFFVSQRHREMGIRMAMGAGRREVLRLVLRRGLAPALAGIAVGLLGALGLTRVVASQLFGAGSSGLASMLTMSLLLVVLVLVSCYLPARRAARLDPVRTLRYE